MTPRYPFVPSWAPQTSICDILKVFPTVGIGLERLGVPPAAVVDCITVGELAKQVGWSPHALLIFLIPSVNGNQNPEPTTHKEGHEFSYATLVENLKREHLRLLGGYISPIRDQWSRWDKDGYPTRFPILHTLKNDFEILCAEISCHFLLEEEELFPYLMELHQACSSRVTAQEAIRILDNKSLTDDGEIIGLVDLFEHLLSRFPSELKGSSYSNDITSACNHTNPNGLPTQEETNIHQKNPKSHPIIPNQGFQGESDLSTGEPVNPYDAPGYSNDLTHGQSLWSNLLAFKEVWLQHEAFETSELFPRILELENHLLRKN
jgi:hypothetical protein